MMVESIAVSGLSEGSHVWLRADSQSRWLWLDLAEALQRLTGATPVLIVSSSEDATYYRSQRPNFSGEIVVARDVYRDAVRDVGAKEDPAALIAKAKALEDEYGLQIFRDMMLADRHLGRAYILGGQGHPVSRTSRKAGYIASLYAAITTMEFHIELSQRCPPRMIVCWGGGGGVMGKPLVMIARKLGIPFRSFNSGRFKNWYFWSPDEYASSPELEAFLEKQPQPADDEVNAVQASVAPNALAGTAAVNEVVKSQRWLQIAKDIAMLFVRRFYWHLRGYRKAEIGYDPFSVAASLIRRRLHMNYLDRHALRRLPDLPAGSKLVYFPLQVEPESSTVTLAPYAANQLGMALELSMSLPADYRLIVKEHIWQLGRRPNGFYDKIRALPNAILMHPLASSLDIVRKSDLVCAISSSAAYEAGVLGKRTCLLQESSPLRVLPHVLVGCDAGILRKLRSFLAKQYDAEAAARAGAQYYLALEQFCADLGATPFHQRSGGMNAEEIQDILGALMRSIAFSSPLAEHVTET